MRRKLLIHPQELSHVWIDRLCAAGVEVLGFHPEGGKQAHVHIGEMLELLEQPEYRALIDCAAGRGLQIEYEMHAASYLLPRELFEEHPEYFRMDASGRRVPEINFCVSNPQAMRIVTDRAVQLAKKLYRSTKNFYFWLDDVADARCHCEKCERMSLADQQLLVMNAIQQALRQEMPQARMAFLAYYETMQLPKQIRPDEGIFLEYAPYTRDMKKPAAAMPQQERENIPRLLDFFGQEHSAVLEYWYDNSLFSRYVKPPQALRVNNQTIREDIAWYRRLGFEDVSSFACFLGADYEALHGEPDISAFAQEKEEE